MVLHREMVRAGVNAPGEEIECGGLAAQQASSTNTAATYSRYTC